MGSTNNAIGFSLKKKHTLKKVKASIHRVLMNAFGNYYDKQWKKPRIYLELSDKSVLLYNEDLMNILFEPGISKLEHCIKDEFNPPELFAFHLCDNTSTRGFSLTTGDLADKRILFELETKIRNEGARIAEEYFVSELKDEGKDADGEETTYTHPDIDRPIYGQMGIIDHIIRSVLLKRFHYDLDNNEFRGKAKLVATDEFPIQDLMLEFAMDEVPFRLRDKREGFLKEIIPVEKKDHSGTSS